MADSRIDARPRLLWALPLHAAFTGIAAAFGAERERWSLWLPVYAGVGILGYFALPGEPGWWQGVSATLCLGLSIAVSRGRPVVPVVLACLLATALGFTAAQSGTARIDAPMLDGRIGPVWVEGRVASQSVLPQGVRVVLADPVIDRLSGDRTPRQVRIRLPSNAEPLRTGARIGIRAILNPPSRPVLPGGFDFRRHAFFQGVGGIGFAVGHASVLEAGEATDIGLWLELVRRAIADRIGAALEGDRAAIATALLTGDRGAIRPDSHDAIREAGLAHLLAISGLHLGLVAGLIFFTMRAALALAPSLALNRPIKKWAAIAALAGAFAYMLVVGSTVPTQRAFAMVGLVLVAVLVDRMAISMRLAAWAAAIVLIISPYSLLGPSFQMSFAAVIALIAGYEALRDRLAGWRSRAGPLRIALLYLSGVMLTTAIASTATAPFALYHFQQIASYGLLTNLLAVPLTALWIMPWGLAAYLLMPLGLEALALAPMGWGISALLAIAEAAAGWPHAVLRVAAPSGWALGLAALAGLWLCLWRGRWRLWGLAGLAAGLIGLVWPHPGPDILISGDGKLMAVRSVDGGLALSNMRGERFIREIWLRADGGPDAIPWPSAEANQDGALVCDPLACLYRRNGLVVALIRDARALGEDCMVADIVVASVPVPRFCRARIVVDRFDVWRQGAHAITLSAAGPTVDHVTDGAGGRPWELDRRPEWERAPGSD